MTVLKTGAKIALKNGGEAEVLEVLGSGGQGTVYRVRYGEGECALKWYHSGIFHSPDEAAKFYKNLEDNIAKGAPSDHFLWPLALTMVKDGSFGYLMEIRSDIYAELTDFFVSTPTRPQVRFRSFVSVASAALNICEAFRRLHNAGYAYQDINNGCFFINPNDGDVMICDNDNVSPQGTILGIMGKQRWMAPEVVTGAHIPDKFSDRFSLAVVLFRLLFINHPLEGRYSTPPCMTKKLERKYYGEAPIFIYDPDDERNRPVPGTDYNLRKFWRVYPQYVRDMFVRAFSQEALMERESRPIETEWLDVLFRFCSSIGRCPHCGGETFYELEPSACIECGRKVEPYAVIQLKNIELPLFSGMTFYNWQVDSSIADLGRPAGKVVANPSDKTVLGVRNMMSEAWNVHLPNGTERQVAPGKPVPVKNGFIVDFPGGRLKALIKKTEELKAAASTQELTADALSEKSEK